MVSFSVAAFGGTRFCLLQFFGGGETGWICCKDEALIGHFQKWEAEISADVYKHIKKTKKSCVFESDVSL